MRKLFFLFVFLLILTTANAKLSILDEQHTTESYSKRVTLFEKLSSLLSSLIQNNNADFGTKVVSFRKLSGLASPLFQNTNTNFDAKVVSFRKLDSLLTIQKIHGTDSFGFNVFVNSTVQEESLLEKYAPVLYFHPDEQFFPTTIDAMLNESDLKNFLTNETVEEMPVNVDSLTLDNVTEDYYLDMRNASPGLTVFGVTIDPFLIPEQDRFNTYSNVVYAREFKSDHNFIALQYWFFYPYNNWNNRHEGDWEMIQVILNQTTEEPIIVTYSIHLGAQTHNWDGILKNKTHPKVFITIGGHGNWDTPGNHSHGSEIFGREVCPFIDETSSGGGILSTNDYDLLPINNKTNWVHYEGRWGEVEPLRLGGTLGVNSIINRQNGRMWNEPIEWGFNPDPSLFIACTGSPVNLNVFDLEGNQVGVNENGEIVTEIPNTYLYLSSDTDGELVVIPTSKDLSFVVTGTGDGKFNLTIGRNTENSSSQIIIEYRDIEVTNQTTAIVNITSTNPNFIMKIDEDGDSLIDLTAIPSNLTIEGNLTNNETDSDNDGYSDSIDNCPNLSNPNQITDFDGDGFDNLLCGGNDCDDSNFYIHPNAEEFCNDIDDNCNDIIDDADGDNDNFNDCNGEDLCLNSIPDSFKKLNKNHFAGNWYGCTCIQILECKPGKNKGEHNYGCSEETIDIWINQTYWAESC